MRAEQAGREAQLDGPELVAEEAELRSASHRRRRCSRVAVCAASGGNQARCRSVVSDSLSKVCSSVSSRSMAYS